MIFIGTYSANIEDKYINSKLIDELRILRFNNNNKENFIVVGRNFEFERDFYLSPYKDNEEEAKDLLRHLIIDLME